MTSLSNRAHARARRASLACCIHTYCTNNDVWIAGVFTCAAGAEVTTQLAQSVDLSASCWYRRKDSSLRLAGSLQHHQQ